MGQPPSTSRTGDPCRADGQQSRIDSSTCWQNLFSHYPANHRQHFTCSSRQHNRVTWTHWRTIAPVRCIASTILTHKLYVQGAQSLTIQRSSPRHRWLLTAVPQRMLVPLEIRKRSPQMHPTVLPPTNKRIPPAQRHSSACRLKAGKLQQQTLMAANVCSTSSGRLFVTDRVSKWLYLVDTGLDLCVFPRKLLPGRRERIDYDLYVANGTTIPTYGWTLQNLNLGLCRNITWRFVVADVQIPIIGVDLLSFYGLLIDCRHNRLLNGDTSLSTPGSTAPPSVPSVKVIAGGTPTENLLQEFPELTKPTVIHKDVRHNTTHHIRTTLQRPI